MTTADMSQIKDSTEINHCTSMLSGAMDLDDKRCPPLLAEFKKTCAKALPKK
jgi:hypothetical protein